MLIIAGMTVGRFFIAFVFVAVIPEISQSSLKAFNIHHIPPEIGDKIGAIFTAAIATGAVVFPYGCSLMNEGLDYRLVTDIFGIFGIGFSVLYILIVFEKGVFSCAREKVTADEDDPFSGMEEAEEQFDSFNKENGEDEEVEE